MPGESGDIMITILLGTFLVLFFALAIVFLITIFNKKNQLHQKEKQIIQASFEQTILQSQLEIQEQTFNTISGEIHDNVGQVLSLVKVQLNILEQNGITNGIVLHEAQENISRAMTDLRDIAKSLNSDRIQEIGLKQTVEQGLLRINRSGIINASLESAGEPRSINARKTLILYRIIQESLQNIIKHAEATRIQIFLNYLDVVLEIKIIDNGKGFDVHKIQAQNAGLGLQNITKRMKLIGGLSTFESGAQKGTCVKLTIPYD